MQALCKNCGYWSSVVNGSMYCSFCGFLFHKSGIDVSGLIYEQAKSVKEANKLQGPIFVGGAVGLVSLLIVLAYLSYRDPLLILVLYVCPWMMLCTFGPMFIHFTKIRKKYPHVYNNPNWKP